MSTLKSRLEKIEGKMKKSNSYGEIIRKHAIGDEGMMVHTVVALYVNSHPEHEGAVKACNYLEWINSYNKNVIYGAYAAIKDLITAGLTTTFMPTEFISDNRDVSDMIPPYHYLCNADQLLHVGDNQFWLF